MRKIPLLFCLLALPLAVGCSVGPKVVPVKGKLTNGGKPVLADKKGGVTLVFIPVGDAAPKGKTYPGLYNPEDETYEVAGPDGKGIPTGKYKVSLSAMSMTSSSAIDQLNAQYSVSSTPIEVEVTGAPLDIDLAKYKK